LNPLRQRLPAATVREHGGRGKCPAGISNGVYAPMENLTFPFASPYFCSNNSIFSPVVIEEMACL